MNQRALGLGKLESAARQGSASKLLAIMMLLSTAHTRAMSGTGLPRIVEVPGQVTAGAVTGLPPSQQKPSGPYVLTASATSHGSPYAEPCPALPLPCPAGFPRPVCHSDASACCNHTRSWRPCGTEFVHLQCQRSQAATQHGPSDGRHGSARSQSRALLTARRGMRTDDAMEWPQWPQWPVAPN